MGYFSAGELLRCSRFYFVFFIIIAIIIIPAYCVYIVLL